MTLNEFYNKFFSRPETSSTTKLYIFGDEDSADNWIKCKYFGSDYGAYVLYMVIQSDMKLEFTVKEPWCKAEVQQFYAVEPDVIAVVLEPPKSEG